jgi:hypothetical protein
MNPLHHRFTVSLKLLLVLTLLLSPFVAVNLTARAAPLAQDPQPGSPDNNLVVLNQVKNADGTTTVTVRIYATPNDPDAPNTSFSMSQDTYIASGNPTGNYGSDTNMGIGYNSAGPQAMRMLIQFNLSSIPSNATVNSAIVYLYQVSASGESSMGFQAQYAVSQWNESNATWGNANYIGGAPLPVGNFPNTIGWLSVNAVNLFRSWVSGAQTNYGLIITGNESSTGNNYRYFYSSNASGNRPYVDISYTTGCPYTTPPTSYVNPLPGTSPNAFTVSWTGTAYTPPGCAANSIASYIVWYQVNGGAFVKWLDGVTFSSAQFNASSLGIGNGALVGFRSQAIDRYGNKTPAGNATAQTTIQSVDPGVGMTPLPTFTNSPNFAVNWTGYTNGGPAITSYNFEMSINGGGWQRLLSNTPQTSYQHQGAQNGSTYQFRAQASNNGGVSFGPWSAPTSTTIDIAPPNATMNVLPEYTDSTSFWVSWGCIDTCTDLAYYNVQYQINDGAWQTLIQNTPQTSFYVQNAQTTQKWGFRVQAVDTTGNQQTWSNTAQAETTIFANPLAVILTFNPLLLQSTATVTDSFPVKWAGATPPGTYLTTVTILYRYNYGTWTLWKTLPFTQTQETFNWVSTGHGDGVYQFQATAANNVGQAPLELPQYAKTIVVDMAGVYKPAAYLPYLSKNAP